MRTSEKTDALWPALIAAKRTMTPVQKEKRNTHFNYTYANEQGWFEAVQPSLLEQGLLLIFSVVSANRTQNLTTVTATARVVHAPSGQWLEVDAVGEGEDKADKAAYKAMTGAKKYLYALAFSLPTTDDAEDPQHDKRRAADEVKSKYRTATEATGKAPTTADVNAALVENGLPPEHDKAAKARAKTLFDQAKLIDYAEAQRLKRTAGTDYAKLEEELKLFIAGAPKKTETTNAAPAAKETA